LQNITDVGLELEEQRSKISEHEAIILSLRSQLSSSNNGLRELEAVRAERVFSRTAIES
jgi:hypothetical protein